MKISKVEVDKLIKEEFQKMMEKQKLGKRLSQINEELGKMDSEDHELDEVEAGGLEKTKSATGLVPGEQHSVKFEKIGTHLKEDEDDMPGEEMDMDMETEVDAMGEFESKFAEIGKAIDAKLAGESAADNGEEMGGESEEEMGGDASDDDFEEVEVSDEDKAEGEEEEIDEYNETHQDPKTGEVTHTVQKESVEEPLEGDSVAQMTNADTINHNMKKDTHVNESKKGKGSVISEAKKTDKKNIFTEGIDEAKKAKLMQEMNRMKKFAGLSKDEE